MARVYISIENSRVLRRFHRALTQAGIRASDMIEVKTRITDGAVLKVVRTECPWAIAVFRSISMMDDRHE